MKLRVHIDSVLLDGLAIPAGGEAQLQDILQRELTRLLAGVEMDRLAATAGSDRAHITTPPISLSPRTSLPTLGAAIARAVFGGISQ